MSRRAVRSCGACRTWKYSRRAGTGRSTSRSVGAASRRIRPPTAAPTAVCSTSSWTTARRPIPTPTGPDRDGPGEDRRTPGGRRGSGCPGVAQRGGEPNLSARSSGRPCGSPRSCARASARGRSERSTRSRLTIRLVPRELARISATSPVVGSDGVEVGPQLDEHRRGERVQLLRPVQGQDRAPVGAVGPQDQGLGDHGSPLRDQGRDPDRTGRSRTPAGGGQAPGVGRRRPLTR